MENFEIKHPEIPTPFAKERDDLKNQEKEGGVSVIPERKEEKGYYDSLREEMRKMKEGGADIHFGNIDIDGLSRESLEIYRKFKKEIIAEEDLKKISDKFERGSADYNFTAMVRNWIIDRKELEKQKEKNLLKGKAEKIVSDLRKSNPHIAARVDEIDWSKLGRVDFKTLIDLNEQSLDTYEERLKEYFSNKLKGKEEIRETLENDEKYRYYWMLRDILQKGPPDPDIFINNL